MENVCSGSLALGLELEEACDFVRWCDFPLNLLKKLDIGLLGMVEVGWRSYLKRDFE